MTDVSVVSDADMLAVNCGDGTCIGMFPIHVKQREMIISSVSAGTWDLSGLKMSGGKVGPMTNKPDLLDYTQ